MKTHSETDKHVFHPILFSTEMVKAILNGQKTMTRRVLKVKGCKPFIPDNDWDIDTILKWNKNYHPYGKVGDILWVRETWQQDIEGNYLYRASEDDAQGWGKDWKWKPSIFMSKDACRLFLEITDIKIERLQDISRDDCKKEGINYQIQNWEKRDNVGGSWYDYERKTFAPLSSGKISPSMSFMSLWKSINGQDSWDKNPYVWVISFKVVERPEDFTNSKAVCDHTEIKWKEVFPYGQIKVCESCGKKLQTELYE